MKQLIERLSQCATEPGMVLLMYLIVMVLGIAFGELLSTLTE